MRDEIAIDLQQIDHAAWERVFDTAARHPAAANHPVAYRLTPAEICQPTLDGIANQLTLWEGVSLHGEQGQRRAVERDEVMRVLNVLAMFDRAARLGYGALRKGAAGWIEYNRGPGDEERTQLAAITARTLADLTGLQIQRTTIIGYVLGRAGAVVALRAKSGGAIQHVFAIRPGAIDRPQSLAVFIERPVYPLSRAQDRGQLTGS